MTTWKLALYCPLLVAWAAETAAPHMVHLKLVMLCGLGQLTVFGSKLGSRSMYMLKAWQPVV